QKLHSAGRVFRRRRGQRINHHRFFLALKFVHRPDLHIRQPRRQISYLRVVRRNNQNVFLFQPPLPARTRKPLHFRSQQSLHNARHQIDFIGRSSCCGSPISTRLFAACDTASTSASPICPASSMNSTSAASNAASGDHSHDVPPTTLAFP